MLIIRNEQKKQLGQVAAKGFEDELVEHLKDFAPRHWEALGPDGVRNVARLGIERAETYGLTNRGPARFYVEMMFLFGSDFDTDPQYPWAGWILTGTWISDQMTRADQLHERTMDYFEKASGPDNQYAIDAMRKGAELRPEEVEIPGGSYRSVALAEMKRIYPQKCEYCGEPSLRALIQRGIRIARRYSVTEDRDVLVFLALMFALGHGFATDPLFPWAASALKDDPRTDPHQRVEHLQARATAYLREALAPLKQR